MHFSFLLETKLPRLAWSARLSKGSDTVEIRHGIGVETRLDRFFEGAWNGPLEQGQFAEADTFLGSGGVASTDGITFAAPSHPYERIYLLGSQETLFVSNSYIFILVVGGETLDLGHRDYFFDFWDNLRKVPSSPLELRTASGKRVIGYSRCNVAISADLQIRHTPKRQTAEPKSYSHLVALLQRSISDIAANAGDASRTIEYRPVAMLSSGYDSTAVAALAARSGCQEAVTFSRLDENGNDTGDDGSALATVLGMSAHRYIRNDFGKRHDIAEAEFCPFGPLNWAPVHLMEEQLRGSLLLAGLPGVCWQDRNHFMSRFLFAYASITEFRLRVGFIMFPALYGVAQHERAIRRMTFLPEMRRWIVPEAEYNKPILRRIAEEAGVPRSLFGWKKRASAYVNLAQPLAFSRAGQADFLRYCQEHRIDTGPILGTIPSAISRLSRRITITAHWLFRVLPRSWPISIMPRAWPLYPRTSHPLWHSPTLYTVHWGVETIRNRYDAGTTDRQDE